MLYCFTILTFKFYSQFTFTFYYKISSTVLVAKCVTANDDWCIPVSNQTRNVVDNDRLAEYSTVKYVADSTVRALPHLFKTKLFYTFFIRCDGSTFDTYTILLDCVSC